MGSGFAGGCEASRPARSRYLACQLRHAVQEDQLAVGIEALQRQLQQLQRAVWAAPHDGIGAGAIGAGGSTAALRASSAASSDLLLARRAELQALEARLQVNEQ